MADVLQSQGDGPRDADGVANVGLRVRLGDRSPVMPLRQGASFSFSFRFRFLVILTERRRASVVTATDG